MPVRIADRSPSYRVLVSPPIALWFNTSSKSAPIKAVATAPRSASARTLTAEDRRSSERLLLAEYRDALALPAAELPSAEEIWLRYRASVAHGLTLWLCTASAGEMWQRPDIAIALAQRYSLAFAELETASALSAIDT